MNSWKAWLHGLIAAAISAFSTSITTMVVDPSKFNLSHAGLGHLGEVSLLSSVLAAALYLKQSPLPSFSVISTTTQSTTSQTVTVTPSAAVPEVPAPAPVQPEPKRNPLL